MYALALTALAAQLTDENGNLAEGDGETECADRLSPGGELLKGGEERDDAVLGDGLKRTKTRLHMSFPVCFCDPY